MGQSSSRCCSYCCPCWRKRDRTVPPESQAEATSNLMPPTRARNQPHKTKSRSSTSRELQLSHVRQSLVNIDQVVRLVLIGSCDSGKTCLLRRFLGGYFDDADERDYTRTLGVDFGCKTVEQGGHRVRLQMWDTGGSETYRSVVSHYLRGADGVIMCFDVNRRASLRDLKCVWAPFMDQHAPKTCRILLAGTKAEPPQPGVRRREVSVEQAKRFAGAMKTQLFETSARHGTNVELAISALIREILHYRDAFAGSSGAESESRANLGLTVALKRDIGDMSDRGSFWIDPFQGSTRGEGHSKIDSEAGSYDRGDQKVDYAVSRPSSTSSLRFSLRDIGYIHSHYDDGDDGNDDRGSKEWKWTSIGSGSNERVEGASQSGTRRSMNGSDDDRGRRRGGGRCEDYERSAGEASRGTSKRYGDSRSDEAQDAEPSRKRNETNHGGDSNRELSGNPDLRRSAATSRLPSSPPGASMPALVRGCINRETDKAGDPVSAGAPGTAVQLSAPNGKTATTAAKRSPPTPEHSLVEQRSDEPVKVVGSAHCVSTRYALPHQKEAMKPAASASMAESLSPSALCHLGATQSERVGKERDVVDITAAESSDHESAAHDGDRLYSDFCSNSSSSTAALSTFSSSSQHLSAD